MAVAVQQASAQGNSQKETILLGTTGACDNPFPHQPCLRQSTLVQLDPLTGALIQTIGPVGFTVNGLAWDGTTGKLYATTTPGDATFHGLLTIDMKTGAGKPVDKHVVDFGLSGDLVPIHSITIDLLGRMVGWYDEFSLPGAPKVTDTFVQIDKHSGIATEFENTGIDTHQNGLAFSDFNILWNIDGLVRHPDGTFTQTAYNIDPSDGKPICSRQLTPPTAAALGDFNPANNLYYGLNFDSGSFTPPFPTSIVVVNPRTGIVTTLGQTVDDLHTLAFVGPRK